MTRRWLVRSGEIEEIIEADSAKAAVVKVFTTFDDTDRPPDAGKSISAIEVSGEEIWFSAKLAIKKAGRWAGDTDASIAE